MSFYRYPIIPGEPRAARRKRIHEKNLVAFREKHRHKLRAKGYLHFKRLKTQVLTAYGRDGTLRCCAPFCGITDIDVLTLDHIFNDGAEERKTISNAALHRKLRREGFPKGKYQTLCMNHNFKKMVLLKRAGRKKEGEL